MDTVSAATTSGAEASAYGPGLPTRADLDAATAATVKAIADPSATMMDVCRAAELEAATLDAYSHRPGAAAELEAGI